MKLTPEQIKGAKLEQEILNDKSRWGEGPWQTEPDRVEWRDPTTELPCLIVRNHTGALCGYVGVPPGHPLYGKRYDEPNVHPHGGLTYADSCQGKICHTPQPGEPDNVWWFGFDCAHAGDFIPGIDAVMREAKIRDRLRGDYDGEYRTIEYVTREVTDLAKELTL